IPTVLSVEEIQRLFSYYKEPCRTAVILDAVSGLRVRRTLGIEVGRCEIRSARIERHSLGFPSGRYSLQNGNFAQTDSHESRNCRHALEMETGSSIQPTWRLDFRESAPSGNPTHWPGSLFRAHVKPALMKAGISVPVGWHTLRHSFGTLMKSNGEDLKTIQELLRHATFKVTADIYTQAVTPVKREPQAKVAKMILADIRQEKPVNP